jgi:N utilization substance protein B
MTSNGQAVGAAPAGGGRRRSAARLAATQALYQIALTGAAVDSVVTEFLAYRTGREGEASSLAEADQEFFADIVRGAASRRDELDRMIAPALAEGWTLERLETILRAILWAGAYELVARPDVPLQVVINEYVDMTHAFFAGREPAFVNGVLDRLARELRPGEVEAAAGGETARGG